jgi:malonyl-CoA O-methyltransferase
MLLVAVDIAREMLLQAAVRPGYEGVDFCCGDVEGMLPELGGIGPFDLIVSNATVQWFVDPVGTTVVLCGMLAAGGTLCLSTFGPDTFAELNESFRQAVDTLDLERQSHVLPLRSAQMWRQGLKAAGVDAEVINEHDISWYADVPEFLQSIRDAGATSANRNNRASLGKSYTRRCHAPTRAASKIR